MVVFEKTSRFAFHLLHEVKSPVRISSGAYENGGNLQDDAIARALAALSDFHSIAHSYKVRKLICVATSAVRDAPNKTDFLALIRHKLKLDIKIISGEKEAYYGAIAAANLLPKRSGITVDIGGGSTESALIDAGIVHESYSLNLGSVRLKELFFDKNDLKGATRYIDEAIATLPFETVEHIVGIGGTFRALSRVIMKRQAYPLPKLHAFTFDAKTVLTLGETVLDADESELKALGIKPERYDIIKSGTLILLRLIKRFGVTKLTSSGVGVREGVFLHDLLRSHRGRFPANFNPSMRYLLDRYVTDETGSKQLAAVAGNLFDLMHKPLQLEARYRRNLIIAAKLAKIGTALHYYSYHHHGYYLIQTALEYGFEHEDILLIATLVRFQKRKLPKKEHKNFYESLLPDFDTLDHLSSLLTLADTLLQHHPRQIDFRLLCEEETLVVETSRPLYLVQEQLRSLPDFPINVAFRQPAY